MSVKKTLKYFFLVLLFLLAFLIGYFLIGFPKEAEKITWGVNFSQKHSQNLGLDWREVYLALLEDLGAEKIKVSVHWDFIKGDEGQPYYYGDLDWQIQKAKEKGAKLLLVIGMKTPRWPECHIPEWAEKLEKEEQQDWLLEYLENIVLRYKEEDAIWAWQVENEPFFSFGNCPWYDKEFLKREIELVRASDSLKRPIIISETGEFSFWTRAARFGDIVGTTLYRKIWSKEFKTYFTHIFPPTFYYRRAWLIENIFGKKVICVELQAEPWGPKLLYDSPLEEQEKTMDLERFQKNIKFAKRTGFDEFYFWGAEWWYWLKEKQDKPEIWEEAKKLFEN